MCMLIAVILLINFFQINSAAVFSLIVHRNISASICSASFILRITAFCPFVAFCFSPLRNSVIHIRNNLRCYAALSLNYKIAPDQFCIASGSWTLVICSNKRSIQPIISCTAYLSTYFLINNWILNPRFN